MACTLFQTLPVARELLNSTIVTLGSVALILIISALAAFALTKLRFRRGGPLLGMVAASMMIPMQSMILTEFINFAAFGASDSFIAVIITYAALGIPFGTFLMTSFMRDLPDDLVEAAQIDGMRYWRIFLNIILPLSAPALLAVGVLQFIQIWDDLLVALIFLQEPSSTNNHRRPGGPAIRPRARYSCAARRFAVERAARDARLPAVSARLDRRPHARHRQVTR